MSHRSLVLLLRVALVAATFLAGSRVLAAPLPREAVLPPGRATTLELDRPLRRIALGDPGRVEAVVVTARELLLTAGRPGRTNLLLWFEDGTRAEVSILVERDLARLREGLASIDPSLRVETTDDGAGLVLTGSVEGPAEAARALEMAAQLLQAGDASSRPRALLRDLGDAALAPSGTADARPPETPPAIPGLVNLLRLRRLPPLLEARLEQEMRAFAPGLSVRRLPRGPLPDDTRDSFVVSGVAPSQPAYWKALSVADRLLGGNGAGFFPLADLGGAPGGGGAGGASTLGRLAGGGGAGGGAGGGTGGGGATGGGVGGAGGGAAGGGARLGRGRGVTAQVSRALGVAGAGGRLISYATVAEIPQVLVAVRVIEISRTRAREVGVDLAAGAASAAQVAGSTLTRPLPPGLTSAPLQIPVDGGTNLAEALSVVDGRADGRLGLVRSRFRFESALRLLETEGLARSLAEPNLLAQNGEQASFQVGDTVGIPVASANQAFVFSSFELFDLGVTLAVRPIVGEDGVITLELLPEVSETSQGGGAGGGGEAGGGALGGGAQGGGALGGAGGAGQGALGGISSGGSEAFRFSTKNLQTTARLREGEGIVIGGLIQRAKRLEVRRTPFLGEIPILGALFRSTVETEEEREVAFAVFPRVVRPRDALLFRMDLPPLDVDVRAGVHVAGELGLARDRPQAGGAAARGVLLPEDGPPRVRTGGKEARLAR